MLTSLVARIAPDYVGAPEAEIGFVMGDAVYSVRNIDGLGPVKATVSNVDVPDRPGSIFQHAKMGNRNIIIQVGFRPEFSMSRSVEQLRQSLYQVYMPGNRIEMDFTTDALGTVRTRGYVESADPALFTDDPVLNISVICNDPYFYPISDSLQTVEIDTIGAQEFSVFSKAYVPVPFRVSFKVVTARKGFILSSQRPFPAFYIGSSMELKADDIIKASSTPGNLYFDYVRYSATNSAMGYFHGQLSEARLYPGPNPFRFNEIDWMTDLVFEYDMAYGGI